MSHPVRCSCGGLQGAVDRPRVLNRSVCYCRDCQAFAHFLARAGDILDARGGTDVVQTLPKHVRFTAGIDNLACMRLTDRGLLRWYARCCNTPIGNTLANHKLSFVGLIHTCLATPGASLDGSFGPIRAHVHTRSAKGAVEQRGLAKSIFALAGMMLRARLDGSYQITPFFAAQTGAPIATPRVLTTQERREVMSRV